MKISFLVTFYNQKEYVKQCLDSILAIDKPNEWEIIVGDDGSSDGTVETVKCYVDKHPDKIFLYVMPRNKDIKYDSVRRASANRLNILKHATGDCYCILDGDDFYFDTSFVREAVNILNHNPDVSIVSFGYKYYTDGKYYEEYKLPDNMQGKISTSEYLKYYYLHAGACVHRLCLPEERIEYIESIGYFDDNDIVVNSLNYGKMYHVPKTVYAYRQTGQSVYTSMNIVEQAMLNVLGMDVDLCLINELFKDDILYRNACSIITMYIFRKDLVSMFSKDKLDFYLQGVSKISYSFCRSIITYTVDSSMYKTILVFMFKNPKCTLKNFFRKFWNK